MLLRLIIASLLLLHLARAQAFYLPQQTADTLTQRYGAASVQRVQELIALMNRLLSASTKEKLLQVNDFFNAFNYGSDLDVWKRSDYWANRMEFMGKARGDCEDYTYAKFFTLKQLGIASKSMRAFYCQSLTYNQPHMVLAYFREGKNTPFILGNYNTSIMPASKRTDLKPIKLYDSEDLFLAKLKKMGQDVPQSKDQALLWLEAINGIRRMP